MTEDKCLNCEFDDGQCYKCYIISGKEDADKIEFLTKEEIKITGIVAN